MSESEENIPKDYEVLKSALLLVQKELEKSNQTLHDYKRQLKIKEALEKEYQEEIQLLQLRDDDKTNQLKAKILQLEENTSSLKNNYNEKINCLENELFDKKEEITVLKFQVETINKSIGKPEMIENENLMMEENSHLKHSNDDLMKTIEELKVNFQLSEEHNLALEEKISQLDKDFESLRETLNCKKDELKKANELIHTLQDDLICTNAELESFRNKPLDPQSRGNSLFAEVDDKRVQLQSTMAMMRSRYLEMKRELAKHVNEITYLSNENATLNSRRETELKEKSEDNDMILDSYKAEIKTLNEVIKSYQEELKMTTQNFQNVTEMKFFDNILSEKKREIEDLRQKLASKSFNQTLLARELAEARQETREWRLECTRAEHTIRKLKAQIEEMELNVNDVKENEHNESTIKSIMKNDRRATVWANLTMSNDDKENEEELKTKTVHFSTVTNNDKNPPKGPLRRASKIIISKPVFIGANKN